jgi:DNA-binding SARP family transcriptional activator
MAAILDLDPDGAGDAAAIEQAQPPPAPDAGPAAAIRLSLLDGFALSIDGSPVDLALGPQRVLAFLAFQERPVLRAYVGGCLWADKSDVRAAANLRAALWRLSEPGLQLVGSSAAHLSLSPEVSVDVRDAIEGARRLLNPQGGVVEGDFEEFLLSGDIMPDWNEDWVSIERERLRQLRLHALEALCGRLIAAGRLAEAIDAALAAVAAEPLRESAHRLLIRVHLAEGNRAEAVRQFDTYREILWTGLGVAPSGQLTALMATGLADPPVDAPSEKTLRRRQRPLAKEGAEPPAPHGAGKRRPRVDEEESR